MIRIRFHGRGGHGTKTASRIVGTAAFLSGFHAQDSPVYGAERRGAAVVAFTRIDKDPILERGVIEQPHFILLADETLLETKEAHALAGQEYCSAMFVNTRDAGALQDKYDILPPLIALDITQITLDQLGSGSALSTGLASAAVAMAGIAGQDQLIEAIQEELLHLQLPEEVIQKNSQVAREVFGAIQPVELRTESQPPQKTQIAHVGFDTPMQTSPSVFHVGNATARHTGSWRFERPVINNDACTRCGLCFVRCPDGAISLDDEGFPIIDYDHCKGCMICHQICPLQAIHSQQETRAW